MLIRLSGLLAGLALVTACHGSGQSSIPDPMSNPGMYFRATPPLSPAHATLERQCAETSTTPASCASNPAR
jgi:hypothetical protein